MEHKERWKSMWDDGTYLPWDRGTSSPSLIDFIANHSTLFAPSGQTALIPGCGRGYDVILFSSKGINAYGLDLAPNSVLAAQKYADTQPPPASGGSRTYLVGDFFENDWIVSSSVSSSSDGDASFTVPKPGSIDIIYDYTFLCALDPSKGLRELWAQRMSELIKPKDGVLICLEFPLYKDPSLPGPPWGLSSEIYKELLEGVGFERVIYEKPERYLEAGKDSDMISVWRKG